MEKGSKRMASFVKAPLLMVAGVKGAVGSTVAAAVAALHKDPAVVQPWLTTGQWFNHKNVLSEIQFAGWDPSPHPLVRSVKNHGVLPAGQVSSYDECLAGFEIRRPPDQGRPLRIQIEQLIGDIQDFKKRFPENHPVLVNLLPACEAVNFENCSDFDQLCREIGDVGFPDPAYVFAAIAAGAPVINFTSNMVEIPLTIHEAVKAGVPICGRDGKTGQTYLKVVIASALKMRSLQVDGWFSLNILGNDDGKNLANPGKAAGKLANKTELLDEILGYQAGQKYGSACHKVIIDYYPPRGDCKEAWDVIDFTGIFGMPMSLRLNLQARDSILAAPMVIDLSLWMAALQHAGRSGPVPELGFYFKKPVGPGASATFQGQLADLRRLERFLSEKIVAAS